MLFHHLLVLASLGLSHKYWDILRYLRNIEKKSKKYLENFWYYTLRIIIFVVIVATLY